ncbi:MAG: hypothetical protein ACK5LK_08230 [Chthoniobacterales bacterium]
MSQPIETQDPEDILIRRILIGAGVVAASLISFAILIVTILLSANFNILNWLE